MFAASALILRLGAPLEAGCRVSIAQKVSHTKCIQDVNFGCYPGNNSMWADAGCMAVFECDGKRTACYSHKNPEVGRLFQVCRCDGSHPDPSPK